MPESPFGNVEAAHEYVGLLFEAVRQAREEMAQDLAEAQAERASRRYEALQLVAWKLERTKWQISERIALIAILVSLPLFYLDWTILTPYLQADFLENSGARGGAEVAVLAHLILFLSAVKLLQVKADRDWFFLYLISFFLFVR